MANKLLGAFYRHGSRDLSGSPDWGIFPLVDSKSSQIHTAAEISGKWIRRDYCDAAGRFIAKEQTGGSGSFKRDDTHHRKIHYLLIRGLREKGLKR